jgi:hypothetical protein
MNMICITQLDYSLNNRLIIMRHSNRLKRTKNEQIHFSVGRIFLLCRILHIKHILSISLSYD